MTRHLPLLILAAALATLACEKASDAPAASAAAPAKVEGTPLAVVGDVTITVEELRANIDRQPPMRRMQYKDPAKLKEAVDQMVRFEVLAQEGRAMGIHKTPEVREAINRAIVQQVIRQSYDDKAKPVPSEEDLVVFYNENLADYVRPERVRIWHTYFADADRGGRDKAIAAAKAALTKLEATKSEPQRFAALAREQSDDPATRETGGDLTYLDRDALVGAWGEAFADAAFKLENVYQRSGVVEGKAGVHLLQLAGRQRAVNKTLEDVRPMLTRRVAMKMSADKFDRWVDELQAKYEVTLHEDALGKIVIQDSPAPGPAVMPVGHGADDGHGH